MSAPQGAAALRSVSRAFLARCAGAAASAAYGLLLADVLAPSAMGEFVAAVSVAIIAATFAKCGLDAYLLRRAAPNPQAAGPLAVRCAAAAGLVGAAFWLAAAFGYEAGPGAGWAFGVFQVAVPFLAMSSVLIGLLKAGNLPAAAVFLETGGWQIALCACAILMRLAGGESLAVVALFFAGGAALAFAATVGGARRILLAPAAPASKSPDAGLGAAVRAVAPLAAVSVCQVIMRWSDVLWLAWWLDLRTLAVYTVCTRLANGIAMVGHAVNAVAAPRFARRHAHGETRALRADFRRAVAVSSGCAALGAVAVTALGPFVLEWLGPPYDDSAGLLAAAAALAAVHVALMPVGHLAAMSDRAADHLKATAAMLALQQAAFLLLVPRYGAPAALLGFALPQALANLLALALIRRRGETAPAGAA